MASSSSNNNDSNINNDNEQQMDEGTTVPAAVITEGRVRPSIVIKLIRHAESRNNQIYRDARFIYHGGTNDFDLNGWKTYVDERRKADPTISDIGIEQSQLLATNYLIPHLYNQSSSPIQIIVSPMKRTIDTIRPTINGLIQLHTEQQKQHSNSNQHVSKPIVDIIVHGYYFESEGCHTNDIAEDGMNPKQIHQHLFPNEIISTATDSIKTATTTTITTSSTNDTDYNVNTESYRFKCVGFPDPNRGWYCNETKQETRAEAEQRAYKFYSWFCDYLDQQLIIDSTSTTDSDDNNDIHHDVFDAGSHISGEEHEDEHDKHSIRLRRRRTAILVGHGDFMSLLLQRIVTGFGHVVENIGIPHRSAFVHFNTGITELEYFGHGRFLIMSSNSTPHLITQQHYTQYRTGGSLKDGWSYSMPNDEFVLDAEVSVAFADEELPDHIQAQTQALKELYLSSETVIWNNDTEQLDNNDLNQTTVNDVEDINNNDINTQDKQFIVKRGLQVVAVAKYSDSNNKLYDVAIRPSGGKDAIRLLINAAQSHSKND